MIRRETALSANLTDNKKSMARSMSAKSRLLLIIPLLLLLAGCNMNESKEARIRKLEAEIKHTTSKLRELENRVQELESPREMNEH